MRKNKLFILGLIATFVAILSLTLVSNTWAKYTSNVTGSATARVAKWSFEYGDSTDSTSAVNLTTTKTITINLFDTILDSDSTSESDVATDESKAIIAPGTKGTGTFVLKNTGEVNAKAMISFKVTNSNNIPVVFTNSNGTTLIADSQGVYTLSEVTLRMSGYDQTQSVTLNWEWPFESASDTDSSNTADTTLGIAGEAELTVEVTILFEQVD